MKKKHNLFIFGLACWAFGGIVGILTTILDHFFEVGQTKSIIGVVFFTLLMLVAWFVSYEFYNKVKEEIKG